MGAGALGVYWYATNNEDVVVEKAFDLAESQFDKLDLDPKTRAELDVFTEMARKIFVVDGQLRRYLVLLQNNMELRPGGGFLGQYAIVEIQDARITKWEIVDANHLDKDVDSDVPAPPSLFRWLDIPKLEFRDSNWEIDFPTNAEMAIHLYNRGPTPQDFDGAIAVNARILDDFLAITGPLTVPDYEDKGVFESGTSLIHLEDIVEKPVLLFKQKEACKKREKETGIEEECGTDPETGEKIENLTEEDKVYRKAVLPHLAQAIGDNLFGTKETGLRERIALAQQHIPDLLRLIVTNLEDRDIQMWFVDEGLQQTVADKNWGTIVDTQWDQDYLSVVDANLGALKSDYYIKRTMEYTVDFTGRNAEVNDASAGRMVRYLTPSIEEQVHAGTFKTTAPLATMKMSYEHTAEKENYRTSDYHAHTRLYAPQGSKWYIREWFFAPTLEEDVYGNKQAFAYKFDIFIGDTLPTLLQYTLPEKITQENYALKIQTQSGVEALPTTVTIIKSDGTKVSETFTITRDVIVRLVDNTLQVEYL